MAAVNYFKCQPCGRASSSNELKIELKEERVGINEKLEMESDTIEGTEIFQKDRKE